MMNKFEAVLQKHPNQDATYIEIPFDVEKVFGTKRVKVKAKFDGIEYRGSIVRMGLPCYIIGITKEIRKKINKEAGESISVEIEKDEEERVIELPEDFKILLNNNNEASKFYESLSYSAKRKYDKWITGAKKLETREKRMQEAISKLEQEIKL